MFFISGESDPDVFEAELTQGKHLEVDVEAGAMPSGRGLWVATQTDNVCTVPLTHD